MALIYKPLSPAQRVWTAIAIALAVHIAILPFAAKDAVFHFAPKPRPATVSLVPWSSTSPTAQHNSSTSPQTVAQKKDRAKTEEEKKKEEELQKIKIDGQIVSIGPPLDERAPIEPTKYLSEYDSRVLKETRARETSAFYKNALSKVQKEGKQEHVEQKAKPTASQDLPPPGDSQVAGKEGGGIAEQAPSTVTPMRARQDRVSLEKALNGTVRTRAASDAMRGDAKRLAMVQPTPKNPSASEGRGEGAPGGTQGSPTGAAPLQLALDNPLESLGPIAGGPMSDALQNVQEGDETLLNSRSFVYASYLNRIKESVARIWTSDVDDAQRSHDPTGQTYLYKDRRTDVDYTLGKDGSILAVKVRQSSGVDFLDEAAVSAFKKLERVPNPPPGLLAGQGSITLGFSFLMMTGTGGPLIRMGPAYLPPSPGSRGY